MQQSESPTLPTTSRRCTIGIPAPPGRVPCLCPSNGHGQSCCHVCIYTGWMQQGLLGRYWRKGEAVGKGSITSRVQRGARDATASLWGEEALPRASRSVVGPAGDGQSADEGGAVAGGPVGGVRVQHAHVQGGCGWHDRSARILHCHHTRPRRLPAIAPLPPRDHEASSWNLSQRGGWPCSDLG